MKMRADRLARLHPSARIHGVGIWRFTRSWQVPRALESFYTTPLSDWRAIMLSFREAAELVLLSGCSIRTEPHYSKKREMNDSYQRAGRVNSERTNGRSWRSDMPGG